MPGIDTEIIHAGEPRPGIEGSVCVPVFRSSMFEYDGVTTDYHQLGYLRLNNSPNHLAVGEKIAALEGAEKAVVTASGMAAISTTMLALLKSGDHVLAQDCLYGGTHDLLIKDLPGYGIQCDFLDADPSRWREQIRPETRLIYTESLTNPTLQVIDHRAVVAFARKHQLTAVIDNTFATPLNFQPLKLGYDLALHSCTKYLNGHSDLVAGAVVGSEALVTQVLHKLNHLGGSLDPGACFLLHRGLKTLGVRVRFQNESAAQIAAFLEASPHVDRVNYPSLASHPQHVLAKDLFTGFGGVLSFELKEGLDTAAFIEHTQLPIHTFSLGGVESLLIQPSRTSHAGLTPEEQRDSGISPGLIRMSVGLEDPADLIADLNQALEKTLGDQ